MNMGTMASGAKEPGWQAAVDDALSTLASVSAGAEMMSGCGLLDGSKTLSYAHLLMEAEVYGIVQKIAGGIEVNDETLALDVIRKVGPERHVPCGEAHPGAHGRDLATGRLGPDALRRLAGGWQEGCARECRGEGA